MENQRHGIVKKEFTKTESNLMMRFNTNKKSFLEKNQDQDNRHFKEHIISEVLQARR